MAVEVTQTGREKFRRESALQAIQNNCSVDVLEKLEQLSNNKKAMVAFEKTSTDKVISLTKWL